MYKAILKSYDRIRTRVSLFSTDMSVIISDLTTVTFLHGALGLMVISVIRIRQTVGYNACIFACVHI